MQHNKLGMLIVESYYSPKFGVSLLDVIILRTHHDNSSADTVKYHQA